MKYPTIDTFDPTIDASKLKTEQLFDIIAVRFMKYMMVKRFIKQAIIVKKK